MPPRVLPEGTARLVPAGSKLMFQVHYTPRGTPQTDRSEIGLVFADPKTIRKEMTAIAAINMDLKIPAGARRLRGDGRAPVRSGHAPLLAFAPHAPARQEVARVDQDLTLGGPSTRKRDDGRYEVTFRYHPPAGTKAVYLAGTFNEWKPTAHKMDGPDGSGGFQTKLILDKGTHEYKFVLDGNALAAGRRQPAARWASTTTVSSTSASDVSCPPCSKTAG